MNTIHVGRPRFEGSNICTWIGFKHVMYLIEEAVLDNLRETGMSPRRLYEEKALGLEILDSDVRIATAMHMDDEAHTEVMPLDDLTFKTVTYVDGAKIATATVKAALVPSSDVGELRNTKPSLSYSVESGEGNSVVWKWRIPYPYCHWSERLQHSGYLRLMEEVVDLFLAHRGISIRDMLAGQRWIPVVPQARVQILEPAYMEEEIHTVFTVENVFKDLLYTARMDCYVPRDGRLVHTATGRITHGYAEVVDRATWKHVPFDAKTLAALKGAAQ